uniref:SWIM-type domain-containing protein n=1 Tax=Anopheles maculatus TaxID=74869 RepID=A0A182SAL7_9DIPT
MRGICKCPHCGTFNGNRALKCKNSLCQQKLKENPRSAIGSSSTSGTIAVQLIQSDGDTNGRLYSVYHRNGLRTIFHSTVGTDGTIGTLTTIYGKDIGDEESIKQTISCCKTTAEAVPLLKETVNSLAVSEEEKLSLWEKRSHPGGPLVQRVSNDVFIVGHWQAAYGLVYVVALKKSQKYTHFQCECQSVGLQKSSPFVCWHVRAVAAGLLSAPIKYGGDRWRTLLQQFVGQQPPVTELDASVHDESSVLSYEYLLATDGDDDRYISVPSEHVEMQSMLNSTMMELFSDQQINDMQIYETTSSFSPTTCIPDMFAGGDESLHLMDCQIELMDELDPTDRIDFCPSFIECEDSLPVPETEDSHPVPDEKVVRITAKKGALKRGSRMAREKLVRGSYSVRKLMKALESNGIIFNRLHHSKGGANVLSPLPPYEATQCNLSFTCWLESVIEQLNSVIDYNTDGKPAVQTFRIHEDFFRCLRARFSVGHRLRQPEPGPVMETDRSSQMYKFTHHKSLLHVFRTDKIELCFEKRFTRGPGDDRYVPFAENDEIVDVQSPERENSLRPNCYSTYIKLGRYKHEPDPQRVYHFSLEWIGGVLPRSGFGELRISFEYGHRMNRQYTEPPTAVTPARCTESNNIQRE